MGFGRGGVAVGGECLDQERRRDGLGVRRECLDDARLGGVSGGGIHRAGDGEAVEGGAPVATRGVELEEELETRVSLDTGQWVVACTHVPTTSSTASGPGPVRSPLWVSILMGRVALARARDIAVHSSPPTCGPRRRGGVPLRPVFFHFPPTTCCCTAFVTGTLAWGRAQLNALVDWVGCRSSRLPPGEKALGPERHDYRDS